MSLDGPDAEATDVVSVSHHLFLLCDEERRASGDVPETSNGLVDAIDGCAFVRTGIHTGLVTLTAEVWPDRPPPLDVTGWDEVVEINLPTSEGAVQVATLFGEDVSPAFPLLTPQGPGTYRLRVFARGRDQNIDGTAFEPTEEYVVQIWPSPPAPETTLAARDRYGAGLRRFSARSAET